MSKTAPPNPYESPASLTSPNTSQRKQLKAPLLARVVLALTPLTLVISLAIFYYFSNDQTSSLIFSITIICLAFSAVLGQLLLALRLY